MIFVLTLSVVQCIILLIEKCQKGGGGAEKKVTS